MKKQIFFFSVAMITLTACTQKQANKSVPTLKPYNPTPVDVNASPSPTTFETYEAATLRQDAQKAMTTYLDKYKAPNKSETMQLTEYKINTISNPERVGKELRFYVDYSIKVANEKSKDIGTDTGTYDSSSGWVTYKHGQATCKQNDDGTYTFESITTGTGGS
jgi:hypothetical protein